MGAIMLEREARRRIFNFRKCAGKFVGWHGFFQSKHFLNSARLACGPAALPRLPRNPMRVLAVIDDPRVVEKILRHVGAWHAPPPRPPPANPSGPHTYEPCEDV